ncbi:type IA DNA topoisomerase [Faecalibacterium sp. An192]|uniref:type IA DNA topoisomerase n=1 Tax=Faecalibacterium sp. An192 TaxID=1965581 RepID=UPI000B3AD535|nr:type IA DNA topoisomerase [Faecalibacterium sp. An192]OUP28813.1 DNA topoisomerase III [Faecalibacterium sp. An192]
MHNLIITEKPSVARTISKVLGVTARRDGYLEGGGYLISWCVGHLVELAPPGVYDPRLERWDRADLPILPERWQYLVSSSTKRQFDVLCKLMHRADVDRIVCATDAGREGELIFRLVYHQCNCRKPVSRLWISSMEDAAIRAGFANLKPSTEYDLLYKAALCRERADWLVGINATRLFSCLHGVTLNVGRVMTPTLAMTVEREAVIASFRPEPFYMVLLKMEDCMASSERFKDKSQAEELLAECRKSSQAVVQKSECKEKSERPPALYDLTTLQRDANRMLGFSAQQTLDYTQTLYEKKLVTYPRTDSRYLTEDMAAGLPGLVMDTAAAFGFRGAIPVHAKQVIHNQKVSDHHAILPTQSVAGADLSSLPAGEASILRLIAARLLAAVGEPYHYAETTVQIECAGQTFTAKGKTVLDEGWKAVERVILGNSAEKVEETLEILTEAQDKETLPVRDAQLKEGRTTPPKHFTEDTLLAAMESAGAETKVNCPNGAREGGLGRMPEEAERRGIGTPATRAATIEKLVQKGFLAREGSGKTKHLIPTEKGCGLIAAMPEQLKSPAMTAEWETKLTQIEKGQYVPEQFMEEIESMMKTLVNQYVNVPNAPARVTSGAPVVGTCPHCGSEVAEREKGWFCTSRECRFVIWKDNAFFNRLGKRPTRQVVDKLLRDGRARLKDCKSQRTGKTYNASVLMTTEADGRAKFSLEFENGGAR